MVNSDISFSPWWDSYISLLFNYFCSLPLWYIAQSISSFRFSLVFQCWSSNNSRSNNSNVNIIDHCLEIICHALQIELYMLCKISLREVKQTIQCHIVNNEILWWKNMSAGVTPKPLFFFLHHAASLAQTFLTRTSGYHCQLSSPALQNSTSESSPCSHHHVDPPGGSLMLCDYLSLWLQSASIPSHLICDCKCSFILNPSNPPPNKSLYVIQKAHDCLNTQQTTLHPALWRKFRFLDKGFLSRLSLLYLLFTCLNYVHPHSSLFCLRRNYVLNPPVQSYSLYLSFKISNPQDTGPSISSYLYTYICISINTHICIYIHVFPYNLYVHIILKNDFACEWQKAFLLLA